MVMELDVLEKLINSNEEKNQSLLYKKNTKSLVFFQHYFLQ